MKFDLKGYNADNLIKTLVSKKIKIYNLTFKNRTEFSFEIDDKYVTKAKKYITNFKTKESFTKLRKLPTFLLANLGVILGVFIGSILFVFLSAFTWQIQVYGTEELSKTDIIKVLKENNIKIGKINLQNNQEIEEILLNKYDRIAQVSVIKEGTAIIINLSEKLVYVEQDFEPIKAISSGIITKVNVVTGTINVKVGDFVNKGDVLVLPFNINADGNKVNVKPLAEITATMFVIGKCELNEEEIEVYRTGKKIKTYNYKFKNINLFSGKNKNSFALFESVVYNENVSRFVPLYREVITFYELATKVVKINLQDEVENLKQKSLNLARENIIAGEILNEETQLTNLGTKLIAISTITILGKIND